MNTFHSHASTTHSLVVLATFSILLICRQNETMYKFICPALVLLFLIACKKPQQEVIVQPHPAMQYFDLGDSAIVFGRGASFDLDQNGSRDVGFGTQLVGDPVEQKDKKQWLITTSFTTNLPVGSEEQLPMLRYLDSIPVSNFSGYAWYNASSVVLVQKTITMNLPPYWEGSWKEASHRFIPIQLSKPEGVYTGWVELSFRTDVEQLILHKAAMCLEANKTILAGK